MRRLKSPSRPEEYALLLLLILVVIALAFAIAGPQIVQAFADVWRISR